MTLGIVSETLIIPMASSMVLVAIAPISMTSIQSFTSWFKSLDKGDKMKESWYARKQIGKISRWSRHPDVKRDRLNERGMKKLRRLKDYPDHELYIMVASRIEILVRVILMPWKWELSLISPTSCKVSPGTPKMVERWQFIAEERYGRVRHLVLQRNVERDIWRIK